MRTTLAGGVAVIDDRGDRIVGAEVMERQGQLGQLTAVLAVHLAAECRGQVVRSTTIRRPSNEQIGAQ